MTDNIIHFSSNVNPDIGIIYLGVNDFVPLSLSYVQKNISITNISRQEWDGVENKTIQNIKSIIQGLRQNNPNIKVVVAKITPCYWCVTQDEMKFFGDKLGTEICKNATEQSPIVIADLFSGFNSGLCPGDPYSTGKCANSDTNDGVHPSVAGSIKIANKFYDSIKKLFYCESETSSKPECNGPVSEMIHYC